MLTLPYYHQKSCWSPCFWHANVRDGSIAVGIYTIGISICLITYTIYVLNGGDTSQLWLPFFETGKNYLSNYRVSQQVFDEKFCRNSQIYAKLEISNSFCHQEIVKLKCDLHCLGVNKLTNFSPFVKSDS